jgi:ubiquinone/menaquinone biosynthesis C-methylase UbiE
VPIRSDEFRAVSEHVANVTHLRTTGAARPALMAALRQQSIAAMALLPGQRVLDVGCGTGTGTLALADAVGASGEVRGVDYNVLMIAEARRRAIVDGFNGWVFYHQANAAALPWPDGYFNASRSDRVLQHMLEPECAFIELLRVTQPGGRVVVIDGDWATLSIDPDEADTEARRAYFLETLRSPNALTGQCLHRLFVQHGLVNIEICVQPVFEGDTDMDRCWQQSRAPSSDTDGRFASANVVMVSAQKPFSVD